MVFILVASPIRVLLSDLQYSQWWPHLDKGSATSPKKMFDCLGVLMDPTVPPSWTLSNSIALPTQKRPKMVRLAIAL